MSGYLENLSLLKEGAWGLFLQKEQILVKREQALNKLKDSSKQK